MEKIIKWEKFTWKSVVFLLVLIGGVVLIRHQSKRAQVSTLVATVSDSLNSKCPMMADSITRVDSVIALRGDVIKFNYTITTADKASFDTAAFKNLMTPKFINAYNTGHTYKTFKDHEISIVLAYYDKNGYLLCKFSMP